MERITAVPRLKERPADSHKGDFGKVLIIAGSWGMSGAAVLAGKAALRAGSGLVRVAVPESILPIVAGQEPCYTTISLEQDDSGVICEKALAAILEAIAQNEAVAFGPGVRIGKGQMLVLQHLLAAADLKLVVDADGLNNLAKLKGWGQNIKAKLILTPHPGEMKRLWQSLFRDKMPDGRLEQSLLVARQTNAVVVRKGAGTIVTDGMKYYINDTGNPGMASGGTGDVLTGIITSLLGQGFSTFDAAVLGVYVHGLAGDIAVLAHGEISLIATDLIEHLGEAFKQVVTAR